MLFQGRIPVPKHGNPLGRRHAYEFALMSDVLSFDIAR
jgi:hypothetical protein